MTVRQVFYQASVRNLVEKSNAGYRKVQTDLVQMRRSGALPYHWLADNTRWQRKPRTSGSIHDALNETTRFCLKALGSEADCHVEVWLEKDALAGVILPVTTTYDVPLMVARGYASLTFLHEAAASIRDREAPAYIYHLGDFDPSGVNAAEKIEQTLRQMAPHSQIHFRRLAVTAQQIRDWSLPTRPTKTADSRSKGFGDICVELDAIEPDRLRAIVENALAAHLPAGQLRLPKPVRERQRSLIASHAPAPEAEVAWSMSGLDPFEGEGR